MTNPATPPAAAAPCTRPGCGGTITATGFCDTCFRRPPPAPPAAIPGQGRRAAGRGDRRAGRPASPASRHAPTGPGGLDRDGLVHLPDVPPPPLTEVVRTTARPPDSGMPCGVETCTGTIGLSYDGGPAPDHGYCPQCGTPFDLRPQLRPGDVVGEQYRVLGYLAPGGTGWVHLAEDVEVPDLRVVLKGLINTGDAVARRRAVEERRSLTTLHHRDIVRIIAAKQHQAAGEAEATGYIVMEYIGGRPLNSLLTASGEELRELFGEPFGIDHVLTYGCKILGALQYLHDQGLLYCDMKPANVIHYGREIKIIDLGAVRRTDDHTTRPVYTPQFAPPRRELAERGFHVDTDLYTVGRTLLALAARAEPAAGLAARSFERLIGRATHDDPAARFTSAPQMSRQLWEVLREHRALSRHEQYPERSTRFEPTAVLFGSALGTIPPPSHWTGRDGGSLPDLDIAAPAPREAARGLPTPIPDPEDPAAVLLGRLAAGAPERIAEQARRDPALDTAETALWLCRAYLRRGQDGLPQAAQWLKAAAGRMGPHVAGYDWRLAWHRGLLHLTREQVRDAQGEFAAVYATVPGEWAPKLALGYCSEYLGDDEERTEEFYEAVWERDRAQGSAAFGLARVYLRRGDRAAAVHVLDRVPSTSRHYDPARIAVVRVLAGRLAGTAPSPDGLREAGGRLADLRLGEARDRLIAEIRENVLAGHPAEEHSGPKAFRASPAALRDLLRTVFGRRPPVPEPDFPALPDGELFDGATSRRHLADLLHRSLRTLADRAADATERGDLLDRAYAVRPETRF